MNQRDTNQTNASNAEINEMLTSFVKDLNDLNLVPFIENFAPNATVFYPRNSFSIGRVTGKEIIKSEFKAFFDNLRKDREGPPYLEIMPKDREILLHNNIAIVSLHFNLGEEFHRRTIVLEKQNTKWIIIHFHASFLTENANIGNQM